MAGVQKADDDEQERQIEAILAAYAGTDWNPLAIELVPMFEQATEQSGLAALKAWEGDPGETLDEFKARVTVNVELRGAFDTINRYDADIARERAAELVGKRLVNGILIDNPNAQWTITDPTRAWLRDEIADAFVEGKMPQELEQAIRSHYAFSKQRAKVIANTEIKNLMIKSNTKTALELGANFKRSYLSADHDKDDFCDLAAAQGEVPIDFDYGLGLKGPLYHPRCWCSITYYVRKVSPEKQLATVV